jgi:Flp pilus assembly protein TadD
MTTADERFAPLEAAVGAQPTDAAAWCRLGFEYGRAEQYELAAEALSQATRFAPEDPTPWRGLAEALSLLGERDEALRAAQLAPRDPDVLAKLGFELLLSGRPNEAIGVLQLAVARAPRWPHARGLLSLAQYNAGDYAAAAETLELSLWVEPDDPSQWVALGVSLAELGRFTEAANALETGVFHSPRSGEAWGRLGQARTELGRHREAVEAFKKAVDLGFSPSGLWLDLGRSAAELRDVESLGWAYEQLRDVVPQDAEFLRQKLMALQQHGRSRRLPRARAKVGAGAPVQRSIEGLGPSTHTHGATRSDETRQEP